MKIYIFICVILFIYFVGVIKTDNPNTLILSGVIYDQFPANNPNFEPDNGNLTPGIVKTSLNTTSRVPELKSTQKYTTVNQNGRIVSPELFQYFFSPQNNPSLPGHNIPIPINLTLTYDNSKGVYVYDNQKFFPIDLMGFDTDSKYRIYKDDNKNYHNYHFCLKISSNFVYKGYEVFNFIGDDDVWVFINNSLAVDLGGLHTAASSSINLKTLGLTIGNVYPIDFFYCERHTTLSTIRIETNLNIICNYYDYCGVCNGDGSTCCNPSTTCNDNDSCTTDICPLGNTNIKGNISQYCTHTPIDVPVSTDKCFSNKCNKTTGNFDKVPITCLDKSNECMTNTGCNSTTGCQYKSKCTNVCDIGKCNNGICIPKTPNDCANELDGNNPDLCSIYSCDSKGNGCKKSNRCQQSSNKCLKTSCNSTNGECINTPIDNPYQGNLCVVSTCNVTNGNFTIKPVQCPDRSIECLINIGCSPSIGCQYSTLCNGVCDTGKCNNGTCISKSANYCANEIDGNNPDLCSIYSCNSNKTGCIKSDKCQDNPNKCLYKSCDSLNGECSYNQIKNPYEGNLCVTSLCDSNTGNYSVTPILCPDRTNECLINIGCNASSGCQYKSLCTGSCDVEGQCNNGTCVLKSSEYCAHELDGDNPDLCSIYSCNSNGTGCNKTEKCVQSSNKCFITSCNSTDGECINTPIENPYENNQCLTSNCNPDSGNFSTSPILCIDRSDECLINIGCNSSIGCQYKSFCNGSCDIEGQCNNGTCVLKSSEYCAHELDGDNPDICSIYSCDTNGNGCIKTEKCVQSSNKCLITSCNSTDGECINNPIENPLQINMCLVSICDPDTGNFTTIPLVCPDRSNECLTLLGCNPFIGCEYESYCKGICEAKDQCNNGTCVPKTPEYCAHELDGDNPDLCSTYKCESKGCGCIKEEKCIKNTTNPCIATSCKPSSGECFDIEIPGNICDCGCDIKNKCMRSHCTKDGKCEPVLREEIDDGNICTDDHCDPCTGIINHVIASKCLNCDKCL